MKVSAQYARDHFDELLLATDNGEEVEVSREGKPSIKLLVMPAPPSASSRPIILGAGRGELTLPTDEEWKALDDEYTRIMIEGPLTTTGEW